MITCKLCNTRLEKKNLRRDGSMLCPVCHHTAEERMAEYTRQSRLSVEMLRARLA